MHALLTKTRQLLRMPMRCPPLLLLKLRALGVISLSEAQGYLVIELMRHQGAKLRNPRNMLSQLVCD